VRGRGENHHTGLGGGPRPAVRDFGPKLIDNISTDELTPGWVCYYYDETLGEYCLVGLRGGVIKQDSIKKGGFKVIVSGRSPRAAAPRARRRRTASRRPASSSSSREEHREDLRAELPEHRPLLDDGLLDPRADRGWRGDLDRGVHRRASIRSAPTSSGTAASSPTTRRASRASSCRLRSRPRRGR
jgi:hypothetical protein